MCIYINSLFDSTFTLIKQNLFESKINLNEDSFLKMYTYVEKDLFNHFTRV